MILEEVKEYFKTVKNFTRVTGFSRTTYYDWKRKGFIPVTSQVILEEFTNGGLKMSSECLNGTTFKNRLESAKLKKKSK